MGKSLVIVESPAKAKTINKYLGKDFVVKSSIGHIRDLPTSSGEVETDGGKAKPKTKASPADKAVKAQAALVRRMGVDPEHGWAARYEVLPGKEKVLKELQEAAAKCDAIYLATDLDREGEAIAWHLREIIGGDAARFKRVTFSEITKTAIQEAFQRPRTVDMDGVKAQQARRFLDRVVGFMVSPLLWAKIARGISAGRVQSVAVRLIVEREIEIHAFKPDEYWELHADLSTPTPLRAQVVRRGGKTFEPKSKADTDAALAALVNAVYRVAHREDKAQRSWPNPPFITSTLQQAASVRLGFSVKKTMTLAQRLYEAGHITYMRTDSVNIGAEALTACRALIAKEHGERYVPEKPCVYQSKSSAQEAHEAIRPTDVRTSPGDLAQLDHDEARLYELIWRQFVACQMPPAEFDTTTVTIAAADCELSARGRVLRFDGFQKVQPPVKQDDVELPVLALGQALPLVKLDPSQHFTKPPPRFSEASLVRELEKRGIGRPSTYAAIISTIQDRGYARLANRRFYAEKLGEIVTERLAEAFPDLMDYSFTASLEEDLDKIATAKAVWTDVLDTFYGDFKTRLADAGERMRPNQPVPTTIPCGDCGRPMAVRTARTGVFLGCTGYSLPPKERCTATKNLINGDEAVAVKPDDSDDESSDADATALAAKKRCPVCSTAMDGYLLDETRKLHICGNNPDCPGIVVEQGQFKLKGYDGPSVPCDKCGASMQLKQGRFGKYFGCTKYPECSNTRKLLRNGQAAPPKATPIHMKELICEKGGYYVLRDGMLGLFLASSLYPRVRDTKPPLVEDLVRHRAELDPKFHWLVAAPTTDPKGNPVQVRFSRKTHVHYLASEKDGESTGWSAFFEDGTWVVRVADVSEAKSSKAAKRK